MYYYYNAFYLRRSKFQYSFWKMNNVHLWDCDVLFGGIEYFNILIEMFPFLFNMKLLIQSFMFLM